MNKAPSKFRKLFGSGPAGVVISLVLFYIAYRLNSKFNLPPISDNEFLLNSIFIVSILLTVSMVVWSFKSLPANDRGNKLCVTGAFKYVRHPLYAAFISIFSFGLAFHLNSFIFILWAMFLNPLWHFIVSHEEKMMIEIFGDQYIEYQKKTGQFFPRLL